MIPGTISLIFDFMKRRRKWKPFILAMNWSSIWPLMEQSTVSNYSMPVISCDMKIWENFWLLTKQQEKRESFLCPWIEKQGDTNHDKQTNKQTNKQIFQLIQEFRSKVPASAKS